jgi:cell division septal protein FtsQ
MQRRNTGTKRANRSRRSGNKLVYKRTEIDEQKDFNVSRIYSPLVFISIAGILYLIFFSGVFNVSEIKVEGTREVSPETVKLAVSEELDKEIIKNNIFLFDADSLGRELKKEYALKKLKIKKHYPDRIDVELEEYVLELGWYTNGKYYLIDEKGKVVGEAKERRNDIPVVEDKKNLTIEVGKSLVTTDFVNFIKYLNQHFPENTGAKITKIEINESFNEIVVYSDLKFYIMFDTTRDPVLEMKNLVTALGSKEVKSKNLTYLDMRVKNKIFYK